jgi:hypothetical protein
MPDLQRRLRGPVAWLLCQRPVRQIAHPHRNGEPCCPHSGHSSARMLHDGWDGVKGARPSSPAPPRRGEGSQNTFLALVFWSPSPFRGGGRRPNVMLWPGNVGTR